MTALDRRGDDDVPHVDAVRVWLSTLAANGDVASIVKLEGRVVRFAEMLAREDESRDVAAEYMRLRLDICRTGGESLSKLRKKLGGRKDTATLAVTLGVDSDATAQHVSSRWQRIAAIPRDVYVEYQDSEEPTVAGALRVARRLRMQGDDDAARRIDLATGDAEGEGWQLLAGDFRDRVADIPDESIDLIVTDPPYPAEFLPLWSDLAVHAARILKPQAILVALSGKINLPRVIEALSAHLDYGWVYCEPLTGSSTRILARQIAQTWKPWLAYSKGPWPSGRIDWHPDTLDGYGQQKSRGRWEQASGPAFELICRLTPGNGLVLDPFTGTGSYGAAALEAGRQFVGIEADTGRFNTARYRLAGSGLGIDPKRGVSPTAPPSNAQVTA